MPDKIKEAFEATKDNGIFLDEEDFRSSLSKEPKAVFELFKADKKYADLFLDYDDFENSLDLKKKDLQGFSQDLPKPAMPSGEKFTQGVGLGVKPISSTASPSASKQPKSTIPSEFTVEKPVSTATADNRDLALTVESRSQRKDYLGKVSEGVLDIINKNPDIYISQKDMPTMYGEKVIPAGTPKVENISKAVDLYAEKIKKETGQELSAFDKQFLVQDALSSLKTKKTGVEASSMTNLQLQSKKKLPLTAITGIKDEKGAVVKEGMFEENIKNIVSEEQKRLEQIAKTPSKEISAEFAPEIEQLKVEVDNTSAALKSEMQSAFTSKFDEIKENLFLEYDGLVKSGQISADEANAQMKKELETVGAQLESDTNILYAPKFEQLKKDVEAKSQEIQTRYNRKVKAQFDLEKEKASKRIQSEVSKYKDALPKGYLEEYQALYQKNFENAMKMDGIKRINEFANLGNFEKMQTALMAGWGDVAGTVGGALSYVGLNTGGLQDWVAQSGIYNELPVFSEGSVLENITNTDWWIANGVRSVPFTIATMPIGVAGGAGAGMLAKALGAGKRAQMISSVVGGGLVGWDAERFLEAGSAFNEAINEGKSVGEAAEIAAAVSKYNYATIPLNIAQMLPVFGKSFKFLNSAAIEAGSGYFEEVTQGWAQAKAKAQAEGQDVSYLDYLTSPQAVEEGIIGAGMSQGFTLLSLNNTPNIDKQINALMTSIGTGGENQAALMLDVMKNNGSIDSKQYEEAKALLEYTLNAIEQTQGVNVEDNIKSALINRFVAIEKAKELLTENENDLASQAAKELIEEKEKEIKNILKGSEPVYLVKIKGNDIPVVSTKEQVDAILSNPASLPLFEIEVYNDIKTQASLDEAYSKQTKDAIQESSTGEVLQRQQEEAGITGSERTGVEQDEQGEEVAQEGQAQEEVDVKSENKASEPSKSDKNYQDAQNINSIVSKENPDVSVLIQPKGDNLVLTAIYVGKGKRRGGIGSKALETIKREAKKLGKKVVLDATNELNQETDLKRLGNFYERNGFKKVGENTYEYDPKNEASSGDTGARTDNTGAEVGDTASVTDKGESGKEAIAEAEVDVVKALEKNFNPDFKNTIVDKLSKFDEQIANKKFPSALEVAEHVLPRSIFNKYKKLYELAARNNITVSNERLPAGMSAAWVYGNIQLNKDIAKYYLNDYNEFAETLNHEIIHGLISRGVRDNYALNKDLKEVMSQVLDRFDSASDEVKDIISYIQDVSKEFTEKEFGSNEETGSLEELITYAFTNKEFADFLDSIPASKKINAKGKSIFQQLKNIIRDFISKKTKNATALDEINSVIDKYFDTSFNEKDIAERNEKYEWGKRFKANESVFDKYNNDPELISEAYYKGDNPKLNKAVDELLGIKKEEVKKEKKTPPQNVLDIAKETGLSPQQIENTYKKYDGSKNIEEITIEDYKNSRATGDKAKLEVSAKAFDALLQQENAKTSTSPTAKKNAEKSLKEADEKALKEASKIMEHINEIRAKLQESGIIKSTSCKWGK